AAGLVVRRFGEGSGLDLPAADLAGVADQSRPAYGPRIKRLLITRLSAMGDVIHTLPAAYALREAFPDAMIGWLIEERWAELLCAPGSPRRGRRSAQRPLVDWVHTVNLAGWRKSLFSIPTLQRIA